ncbi:hypothetical protein [Pseudarthrobacter sp. N5]
MIKKLQDALFSRKDAPKDPKGFNGSLLDQHREDIYIAIHQQMGGLR